MKSEDHRPLFKKNPHPSLAHLLMTSLQIEKRDSNARLKSGHFCLSEKAPLFAALEAADFSPVL